MVNYNNLTTYEASNDMQENDKSGSRNKKRKENRLMINTKLCEMKL